MIETVEPPAPAARAAAHNAEHYDDVTAGWDLIMGRHLHFGLFDGGAADLAGATERMVQAAVAAPVSTRPASSSTSAAAPAARPIGCVTDMAAAWCVSPTAPWARR